MLNIRKRFFILLTIVGLLFGLAACTKSADFLKLSFDNDTYEILVGQTINLEPMVSKGSSVGDVQIEYTSYDDSIATYSDGLLTGVEVGETTIKVVCPDKPVAYDTATVKVILTRLPEVSFSIPTAYNMVKGATKELTFTFVPDYANAVVTFQSANRDVATIDESGLITAVGVGEAIIVARVSEPETNANAEHRDYVFTITVVESDFTINYNLDGGTNNPDNPAGYNVLNLPLELKEPTKEGYEFLGWYLNADFEGEAIEELSTDTYGNVDLWAKWKQIDFKITYHHNGGSWYDRPLPYSLDRQAMVDDFLKDAMEKYGVTVKPDNTANNPGDTGFANKFSAIYGIFTDEKYAAKWSWLKDYLISVSKYKTELEKGTGGETFWRYTIGAFLFQEHYTAYPNTDDFTNEDLADGFWDKLLEANGIELVTVKDTYRNDEEFVLPESKRPGATFKGWYLNGEKIEKIETGSKGDIVLEAEWELLEYNITYDVNGGDDDKYLYGHNREAMVEDFLKDAMEKYGKTVKPDNMANKPAGTGFANIFGAIYEIFTDPKYATKWAWLKDYMIETAPDNIKASLESGSEAFWRYGIGALLFKDHNTAYPNTADFTEDLADGFWDKLLKADYVDTRVKKFNIETEVELYTPTKYQCEFLGWLLNGELVHKIEKNTVGDVTLVAKWYDPNATFDIDYQLAGGKLDSNAPKTFVAKDGLATLPTPTKAGYKFLGWYKEDTLKTKVESIEARRTEGITLYASWEMITYSIDYELHGGTFVTDKVVSLYESFDELVQAFLTDYSTFNNLTGVTAETFYGKSSQRGLYSFFKNEEMATKWNWLLDFVVAKAEEVRYTGKAYLRLTAGAANFNKYARANFAALLQQTQLKNPVSMDFTDVDGDALWAACPTKLVPAEIEAKKSYTVNDLPLKLAKPVRDDATFVGWYTNEDLKNGRVDEITTENINNFKLYARWSDSEIEFDTYTITYDPQGGVIDQDSPEQYVEETGVKLKGATKKGYTFAGWYLKGTETLVTELTKEDKGNKELVAKWTLVQYTIDYEVGDGTLEREKIKVSGYESYEELRDDFLKDAITYIRRFSPTQKDITHYNGDPTDSAWGGVAYPRGGLNIGQFFDDDDYKAKWSWLKDYIISSADPALKTLLEAKDAKGVPTEATWRWVMGAFIFKEKILNVNNATDYTDGTIMNGALDLVKPVYEFVPDEYNVEGLPKELSIPTAPEGKKFVGWYTTETFDGDPWYEIPADKAENLKLYAKYIAAAEEEKYRIVYVLGDGASLVETAPKEYVRGTGLDLSTVIPTKEHYDFKGWFLDAKFEQAITAISAEQYGVITLYANFELQKFEIEFNNNGEVKKETLEYGAKLPDAENGEYGYKFAGWFEDESYETEVKTTVTGAMKLYAKWETTPTYNEIEYVLAEGEFLIAGEWTKYDYWTGLVLPVALKKNNKLVGWSLEANGNSPITKIEALQKQKYVLYPVWEEVEYDWVIHGNAKLSDVLSHVAASEKIYFYPGTYEDNDVTISVNGLTILGPNAGKNPNTAVRDEEAVIKFVIKLGKNIDGLTIDGLEFTGRSRVETVSGADKIVFKNNNVHDITATPDEMKNKGVDKDNTEYGYKPTNRIRQLAFLMMYEEEKTGNDLIKDITVQDNKFVNLPGDVMEFSRHADGKQILIDGNVMKNFKAEAIRFDGGYNNGNVVITNNTIENDTLQSGAGILFRAYCATAGKKQNITIQHNTFKNIGDVEENQQFNEYIAAIAFDTYNDKNVTIDISYNTFENCNRGIFVRELKNAKPDWTGTFNYNYFKGMLTECYRETDGLGVAKHNYCEDAEGTPITEADALAKQFVNAKTADEFYNTKDEYLAGIQA